jgi:endonuclease/exonuclease/phosphatase family metal-dependent hydrolase
MKIATWNIERPVKTSKRIPLIIDCLKKIDADILILTETNEVIDLGKEYTAFHTSKLSESYYKEGEKRVGIYTKYNAVNQIETFRNDTSICINVITPNGNLAVYGTIIGINGSKRKNFVEDLDKQIIDFERLTNTSNLCIGGDLNISFSDNYYFTTAGRLKLNTTFDRLHLVNLTASLPQNIDHIILPKHFIKESKFKLSIWNSTKKLSDHIGVMATIEP